MMPQIELENRMVVDAAWEPWRHKVVTSCDECGCDIYEGEDYFLIEGAVVCEQCIRDYIWFNYRREG